MSGHNNFVRPDRTNSGGSGKRKGTKDEYPISNKEFPISKEGITFVPCLCRLGLT